VRQGKPETREDAALYPRDPTALRSKSADRNRRWRMATRTSIPWIQDPDEALARAREEHKPVLYDFSAAPM
jgi:hypothetical protein